jgi:two-component system KDP operon response regulator KdpE
MELIAFSGALLRRSAPSGERERTFYADGAVELDLLQAEVHVNGTPVHLTPLEMRLLTELMEHPNQTLSAAQLLDRVWGPHVTEAERVKIYIGYLRAKFKAAGTEAPIVTVRGFGYRYVVEGV